MPNPVVRDTSTEPGSGRQQESTQQVYRQGICQILHRRIFLLKILHRQFNLIPTVLVRKTQKMSKKLRNLHRWQKFYTAAGADGMDKFHL